MLFASKSFESPIPSPTSPPPHVALAFNGAVSTTSSTSFHQTRKERRVRVRVRDPALFHTQRHVHLRVVIIHGVGSEWYWYCASILPTLFDFQVRMQNPNFFCANFQQWVRPLFQRLSLSNACSKVRRFSFFLG